MKNDKCIIDNGVEIIEGKVYLHGVELEEGQVWYLGKVEFKITDVSFLAVICDYGGIRTYYYWCVEPIIGLLRQHPYEIPEPEGTGRDIQGQAVIADLSPSDAPKRPYTGDFGADNSVTKRINEIVRQVLDRFRALPIFNSISIPPETGLSKAISLLPMECWSELDDALEAHGLKLSEEGELYVIRAVEKGKECRQDACGSSSIIRNPIFTIDGEDVSDMFYQRISLLRAESDLGNLKLTRDLIQNRGIFVPEPSEVDIYRLTLTARGAALNLLNMVIGIVLEDGDAVSTCEGWNELGLLPGEATKKQPNKEISSQR